VPQASPTSSATYSATWIGIDGFSNSSLIQAGTEQDYYNGAPHYAVWWTTSANGFYEQPISHVVYAGDPISAKIISAGSGNWTITLSDSSGQFFSKTLTYSGPGTSAEWIVEAPGVNGRQSTIANYSNGLQNPMLFNPTTGGVTGRVSVSANGTSLIPVALTYSTDSGQLVALTRTSRRSYTYTPTSTPSPPDTSGSAFNMAYGSVAPPTP